MASQPWSPSSDSASALYLDAELRPNRSLSQRGLVRLALFATAAFAAMGLFVFALHGVLVVHLYLLVALSGLLGAFQLFRAGSVEVVRVSADEVTVLRRRQLVWRSPTLFTRVEMEDGRDETLALWQSDRRMPIARALGAEDRRAFARELEAAISRAKRGG